MGPNGADCFGIGVGGRGGAAETGTQRCQFAPPMYWTLERGRQFEAPIIVPVDASAVGGGAYDLILSLKADALQNEPGVVSVPVDSVRVEDVDVRVWVGPSEGRGPIQTLLGDFKDDDGSGWGHKRPRALWRCAGLGEAADVFGEGE